MITAMTSFTLSHTYYRHPSIRHVIAKVMTDKSSLSQYQHPACLLLLINTLQVNYSHRSQLKTLPIAFRVPDPVIGRWRVSGSSGTSIGYQRFSKDEYGLI